MRARLAERLRARGEIAREAAALKLIEALRDVRFEADAGGGEERVLIRHSGVDAMRTDIVRDGWNPLLIRDRPGTHYPEHEHVEAKLLVFVAGSMVVETGGQRYQCAPGDQLVIPRSMRHAAWVGDEGCTFFWSEQNRGSL